MGDDGYFSAVSDSDTDIYVECITFDGELSSPICLTNLPAPGHHGWLDSEADWNERGRATEARPYFKRSGKMSVAGMAEDRDRSCP